MYCVHVQFLRNHMVHKTQIKYFQLDLLLWKVRQANNGQVLNDANKESRKHCWKKTCWKQQPASASVSPPPAGSSSSSSRVHSTSSFFIIILVKIVIIFIIITIITLPLGELSSYHWSWSASSPALQTWFAINHFDSIICNIYDNHAWASQL